MSGSPRKIVLPSVPTKTAVLPIVPTKSVVLPPVPPKSVVLPPVPPKSVVLPPVPAKSVVLPTVPTKSVVLPPVPTKSVVLPTVSSKPVAGSSSQRVQQTKVKDLVTLSPEETARPFNFNYFDRFIKGNIDQYLTKREISKLRQVTPAFNYPHEITESYPVAINSLADFDELMKKYNEGWIFRQLDLYIYTQEDMSQVVLPPGIVKLRITGPPRLLCDQLFYYCEELILLPLNAYPPRSDPVHIPDNVRSLKILTPTELFYLFPETLEELWITGRTKFSGNLPGNLQVLGLQNFETSFDISLPENLKELHLIKYGRFFSRTASLAWNVPFPQSVEVIKIENSEISINTPLPSRLRVLDFGYQSPDIQWESSQFFLPASLTALRIEKYDQRWTDADLPPSLKVLAISGIVTPFNQKLPENLQELYVGDCSVFSRSYSWTAKLPDSLTKFETMDFVRVPLPQNLKHLKIENFGSVSGILPESLEKLIVENYYGEGGKLPRNLKELTLKNTLSHPVKFAEELPQGMVFLRFGTNIQITSPLPNSIERIVIEPLRRGKKSEAVEIKNIPTNLQSIKIEAGFKSIVFTKIPTRPEEIDTLIDIFLSYGKPLMSAEGISAIPPHSLYKHFKNNLSLYRYHREIPEPNPYPEVVKKENVKRSTRK